MVNLPESRPADSRWLGWPSVAGGMAVVVCVACLVAIANDRQRLAGREAIQQLEAMAPQDRQYLSRQRERFTRLGPQQQEELRQLAQQLNHDPQGERLLRVMRGYAVWLSQLPSVQRADLLAMPHQERLAEIRHLLREQELQRFEELLKVRLEPLDLETISEWLRSWGEDRQDWLVANERLLERHLSDEQRMRMRSISDGDRRRRIMLNTLFLNPDSPQSVPDEIPIPREADVARMTAQLSEQAREILASVTPEQQLILVKRWCFAAFWSRRLPPVDSKELARFYQEELNQRDREYLERLTGERMQQALLLYYHRYRRNAESGGETRFGSERRTTRGRGGFRGPPTRPEGARPERRGGASRGAGGSTGAGAGGSGSATGRPQSGGPPSGRPEAARPKPETPPASSSPPSALAS